MAQNTNLIKKHANELCTRYIENGKIDMFLLEYIKNYYNESLVKFTKIYSEMFDLDLNEIGTGKLTNNDEGTGARVITRCFISRVYWKKLLTGLYPYDADSILIKCRITKQNNSHELNVRCFKYINSVQANFDFSKLGTFLENYNYNNKVITYIINPDHEFNLLVDKNNLYIIQSWLFQYPLRIYHIKNEEISKKIVNIFNNFIVNIYKLNHNATDLGKIFYKLFMCYREKYYTIDNKNIIFRTIDDYYVFDMSNRKEFTKKMKIMINNFNFDKKDNCLTNLENQHRFSNQKGSGLNDIDNLDKKEYLIIKNLITEINSEKSKINSVSNESKTNVKTIFLRYENYFIKVYFITINNIGNLNYVYFSYDNYEYFIKLEKNIYHLLFNYIVKFNSYLKNGNGFNEDDKIIFLLLGLYFQQKLLTVDIDNTGHAYYEFNNEKLSSIVISESLNIKLIKAEDDMVTKGQKFYCNNTDFDKFIQFIMKAKYNRNMVPCIRENSSTLTGFIQNDDKTDKFNKIIENLNKVNRESNKDFDKYLDNLEKYKIREDLIKICNEVDYLGLNLLYNKISKRINNKHNTIDNNDVIYFLTALYLNLMLIDESKINQKYIIFVNTLYKDIDSEFMMLKTTGKLDEYIKKYHNYNKLKK